MDKTVSLTTDLPFQILENNIWLRGHQGNVENWSLPKPFAGSSNINPGSTLHDRADDKDWYRSSNFGSIEDIELLERQPSLDATSTTHTISNVRTLDSSVVAALKSVVPKSFTEEDFSSSSVTSLDTSLFTTSLHRQILFSLANNMAGLDDFSMEDVIHFLKTETGEKLYQLVVSDRSYSSRAIVQILFKAAIEAGNARLVDMLIRKNPMDIKINEQFCSIEGHKYTPIERAALLRHKDVVQSLLNHGADVNRTYSDDAHRGGALNRTVFFKGGGKVDTQIFQMLLEAGGKLSDHATYFLGIECIALLLSKNAGRSAAELNEKGIFHNALHHLDSDTSMEMINIMLNYGVDLNYERDSHRPFETRHVIDAAADNGNMGAVKILLDSGALLTGGTLPLAIKSGNQDFILLLLAKGADINGIGDETPLAAAIRLQDEQILRLIEERGASAKLQGQRHFLAALDAASEVGNVQYIEDLIRCRDQVSSEDLGYALHVAIEYGYYEDAKSLIDAGASANVEKRSRGEQESSTPLFEALKQRNEYILPSLLDADANPNYKDSLRSCTCLAAEWGNRSVLENLVFAGATISEHAVAGAVKRRDREMLQFLIHLGAKIEASEPLEAAIENGDIEMTRFLLDQGADPNNSEALREAMRKDKRLVNLLFERYDARSPMARGDFGADLLEEAVVDGNERVIRQLLERGVNASHMFGLTGAIPFGVAIANQKGDDTGILELFLQNGCTPDDIVAKAPDLKNDSPGPMVTALLAAIGTKNIATVDLFLKYNADVNFPTRGRIKRTPLQRAAEVGSLSIVELLINYGANVNAPAAERSGGTALQFAAIQGYIPIACKLLSLKADPNAPASKVNGRTALDGAAEHGRLDMVQVLLNGGAASRSGDEAQIEKAIAFAYDNGHYPICDLLRDHLSSRGQGSGMEFSLDDNHEDDLFDARGQGRGQDSNLDDNNEDITNIRDEDDPFAYINWEEAE